MLMGLLPVGLKITLPETLPSLGRSRIMERAVTDFPEPDSPTMPTVSLLLREKLIPLTACKGPSSVLKVTLRFFISRRDDTVVKIKVDSVLKSVFYPFSLTKRLV